MSTGDKGSNLRHPLKHKQSQGYMVTVRKTVRKIVHRHTIDVCLNNNLLSMFTRQLRENN